MLLPPPLCDAPADASLANARTVDPWASNLSCESAVPLDSLRTADNILMQCRNFLKSCIYNGDHAQTATRHDAELDLFT